MSLKEYTNKRSLDKTPEPRGGTPKGQKLRFVIQKHQASRLHYDFRLEVDGVFKSWAVPKGPSINPSDRRLAIAVEDHPYDYKDFEGIIPKGNYGAGTVIVWDEGTYEVIADQQSQAIQEQYEAGSVKIRLDGEKLKGEFALVRMKGDSGKEWLLIKHKDEFAAETDILLMDKSVKSGKTLEEFSEDKFPAPFSPMLATLSDEPFDDESWEFEVKWDGYRAMAFMNGHKSSFLSRNGQSFKEKFPPIWDALQAWNIKAVVDGEIVAINTDGTPNFQKLQHWKKEPLYYYVFDILWYDGKSLNDLPLIDRKKILASVLPAEGPIRTGFSVSGRGKEFYEAVKAMGFEGMIAKRAASKYQPDHRSADWLKIKIKNRQEVIIAGYTKKEGSPRPFSALLMAVHDKGKLRYAGKVGTGFKDKEQSEMIKNFKKLQRKRSPFSEEIKTSSKFSRSADQEEIFWMKPQLIAEIQFAEVTESGVFRHPSFIALRTDKEPAEVVREYQPPKESTFIESNKKRQRKEINGKHVSLTNVDKVYWPEDHITKGEMLDYYHQVAKYMLPHLKDRPQSLNRFPEGITGENFYQKDVTGKVPSWIEKYPYKAEGDNRKKHYMLCNDAADLLYMANLGAIEINPWNSTTQKPDHPDWCVLDLDPDKGNTFEQVIEVAQAIHEFLTEKKIHSCCKTSGSTGIHVFIPLGAKYPHAQSQLFAKWIAASVNEQFDFTSIERATSKRKGKIYIDFLQNRPAATVAAVYSLRPKPGATVSMPLHWEEVKKGLQIADFNITNALDRIKSEGDLFKAVLGKGADLKKILTNINEK